MAEDRHLSRIETLWSVVRQAHDDGSEVARTAQDELLERYGGAARRYLLAALREENAADEVFQEFALRFVRGDFRNADPGKGRFRAFLKTVLYRLIIDHQKRKRRDSGPDLDVEHYEAPAEDDRELDAKFQQSWRDELLARTWQALQTLQEETGKPLFRVLQYRVQHPELRSPDLAAGLSEELNKPISAANVRVLLHRAREAFADQLLDEVKQSLETDGLDAVEAELIELGLHEYCRPALDRKRDRQTGDNEA